VLYTCILVQVKERIGRWNSELYGVYSPLSGVTTNQSEGSNSVLKRLQGWKEIPVDTAVHLHSTICTYTIGMSGNED